jgi:hypothetical protein
LTLRETLVKRDGDEEELKVVAVEGRKSSNGFNPGIQDLRDPGEAVGKNSVHKITGMRSQNVGDPIVKLALVTALPAGKSGRTKLAM